MSQSDLQPWHEIENSSDSSKDSSNLVAVGDRIFIKSKLRKHKFVQKFLGPFQVIALYESYVYCYSVASKKHKLVNMDRARTHGRWTDY